MVTEGNNQVQVVTEGYTQLQEVTEGYTQLQVVTDKEYLARIEYISCWS